MKRDLEGLRSALLDFYDRRRRDLPWRGEQDPYRILVSEVMLQQTRVETVLDYYERWIARFPDFESLAAADEEEVLRAWEGLGYYRRARHLHAAAKVVRERASGDTGPTTNTTEVPRKACGSPSAAAGLPRTAAALRELPGVGEYTAGAVASIAFGEAVPAVDGNVRRVLSRLFDEPAPTPAWLRDTAQRLVARDRPGDWNQALMELGATVCTPRSPRCVGCPVAAGCRALVAGTVADRPAGVPRRKPRPAMIVLAVIRRPGGEVLMVRRPRGGLLGGMWALPEREIEDAEQAGRAVRALALELTGTRVDGAHEQAAIGPAEACAGGGPLPPVRHRFSHIDATYVPWVLRVPEGSPAPPDARWTTLEERTDLAVPVAQRRVLEGLPASPAATS